MHGNLLDVYRDRRESVRRGVIVFLYGGAWGSGDKAMYPLLARTLVLEGFVVVIPNYTLFPRVCVCAHECVPACARARVCD